MRLHAQQRTVDTRKLAHDLHTNGDQGPLDHCRSRPEILDTSGAGGRLRLDYVLHVVELAFRGFLGLGRGGTVEEEDYVPSLVVSVLFQKPPLDTGFLSVYVGIMGPDGR